jgi:hypothetical protein
MILANVPMMILQGVPPHAATDTEKSAREEALRKTELSRARDG